MTGKQLKELLKICDLNQKQAAEQFGVCEATMSTQIQKGEKEISNRLAKTALEHSLKLASEKLQTSMFTLADIINQLLLETK